MHGGLVEAQTAGCVLIRKLGKIVNLTGDEVAFLRRLDSAPRRFNAHVTISASKESSRLDSAPRRFNAHMTISAGKESSRSIFLFVEGWGIKYWLFPDGRRQILNFVVPGDIVGLRSSLFQLPEFSVETLTEARVCRIELMQFIELYDRFPRVFLALLGCLVRDYAIVAEHLVGIGRRSARERIASLLIELMERMRAAGLVSGNSFDLPVSQECVADAMGLCVPYVNRTLQALRRENLIHLRSKRITVLDMERLAAAAGGSIEDCRPCAFDRVANGAM